MRIEQTSWTPIGGWRPHAPGTSLREADLLLVFAEREVFKEAPFFGLLAALFPDAILAGCSTAGEIHGTQVLDHGLVCNAIKFDRSTCSSAAVRIAEAGSVEEAGRTLANRLPHENLRHVLVLSDGLCVNGTQLIDAMTAELPDDVTITGGLAGDSDQFAETWVCADKEPCRDAIMAVGLHGDHLVIGTGSRGGWDTFGPERLITRSRGNELFELDGQSALGLYKQYLGDYADQLPASGLLFPLAVRKDGDAVEMVRTILGVDEATSSMRFAGEMPEGAYARFMKANLDRLVDGAMEAAVQCRHRVREQPIDFALLISCVGRKMVLKQRVEEEVESVREVLGARPVITGFYSYGEMGLCPEGRTTKLLNQTMTITTLSERAP